MRTLAGITKCPIIRIYKSYLINWIVTEVLERPYFRSLGWISGAVIPVAVRGKKMSMITLKMCQEQSMVLQIVILFNPLSTTGLPTPYMIG